ncbi:hypothetical protein FOMPIDRAFT_87923 [Fomitopsis schrenkii]|uniref:F-box domain-containing protein n=1 Tax=Fomitopsis schrenkii TaxID=2126942 RepID=S8EEQ6_FOMSC|nr:hypothetical protein FOMPIDRAFT_87923 [Fomitopsis schrenkii]
MQPRLIENDDVLHEVFRFLDPSATEPTRCIGAQEHENRCRTALARSARASKVISEHALNVLWRRSEGLLDIFSILPPFKRGPPSAVEPSDGDDVDVHDGPPKVKGLWRFTDAIAPADWGRYQTYAQRVRVLSLAWTPGKIDPSVFSEISRLSDGGPLFPGLTELDIQTYDPFEHIPSCLISPSLRKLFITDLGSVLDDDDDLDFHPPESPLADLVRVAFVKARLLEEVTLTGSNVGPMENLLAMADCSRLRRVSVVDLAPDARLLEGWSRIESLGDLTLEVHPDSPVVTRPLEFARLHCLTVRGNLKHLSNFLAQVFAPCLSYLRMEVQQLPSHGSEELPGCLATVSAQYSSTLRHFHLAFSGDGSGGGEQWPEMPLVYLIRPLLDMPLLQTVSITPPRGWSITLSDEGIHDIAVAWPSLVSLRIYLLNANSTATWESLGELARGCTRLRTLALPHLDLRTFVPPMVDKQLTPPHPLEVLTLDYSFGHNQVDDSHKFAQFLDRTFPNLDLGTSVIRRVDIPGGRRHPQGREVMELLRSFQQARQRQVSPNGKLVMVPSPTAQTVQ